MRAALIFSLAIVMLPLSGCDIFIDNFGEEHMPCREINDCIDGLECVQQTCVTVDSISGITHPAHALPRSGRSIALVISRYVKIWILTGTRAWSVQ